MLTKVHVPTCAELAVQGLAIERPSGRGTAFTIKPEGQAMIYDAMKHNAEVGRLEDAERIEETARQRYIWDMINGKPARDRDSEHDDWRRAERESKS